MSRKDRYKKKLKQRGDQPTPPSGPFGIPQGQYEITDKPLHNSWTFEVPKEVLDAIPRLMVESIESPRKTIPELLALIERYPDIPLFPGYLSNAYAAIGDLAQMERVFQETLKRFPDYIFARSNYAVLKLKFRKFEEAYQILGGKYSWGNFFQNENYFT